MKQKVAYMSIGFIFTVILSFAWLSLASQPSEAEGIAVEIDLERRAIKVFDGEKTREFALEEDTVVYKNNERGTLSEVSPDDAVKVIMNSDGLVRYVVAASEKETAKVDPDEPVVKDAASVSNDREAEPSIETIANASPAPTTPVYPPIRELELEIKDREGRKMKVEYKNKDGKMKWKQKNIDVALQGEAWIRQLALTPDMNKQEMAERVFETLSIDRDIKKFELEVEFANGNEVEIEWEK